MKLRPLVIAGALAVPAVWACVGEPPKGESPFGSSLDAGSDSSTTKDDGSTPTNDSGPDDTGNPDGGDSGPRCDPKKAFNEVVVLDGISTADDERGVWVSADELTAYVAVVPAAGSTSNIKKSIRPSTSVAFSAPTVDAQLVDVNVGSVSIPSLTADGLVLVYAKSDGIYASVRGATTSVFPAGVRARSRGNPISPGDPFLTAGGESLLLGRDNGVNGYELDDAPRDIGGIYGDGGFVDYAVAPGVTNVNDDAADDRRPIYSPDRLTLVFASNRAPGSNANTDLYIAQRAGVGGTFTSPLRMAEPVSSASADLPGSLSSDGCVLYFTSDRPGGFGGHDVYIAKRPK